MAHNPHAHLQREIDSLRKQLIQERDQRRYDDALHITSIIKQAEERVLERCIVECMEEANAPIYTEEERVAILTAAERLKEMRSESVKVREEKERIAHKRQQESLYQQVMHEAMNQRNVIYRTAMDQAMLQGASITSMVMDEAADVRWSNISNPKEWLK
jgi:hypothetical protein